MVEQHNVGDPEDFSIARLLDTAEIRTHEFLLLHFPMVLFGEYFDILVLDLSENVIAPHK